MDKNDPRLTAYVLGELNEKEAAEVESLVADSPELKLAISQIEELTRTISDAYENELASGKSANIDLNQLQRKVNEQKSRSKLLFWATACSLAILLGSIAIVLTNQQSRILGVRHRGGIDTRGDLMLSPDDDDEIRDKVAATDDVEVAPKEREPEFLPLMSLAEVDEDDSEVAIDEFEVSELEVNEDWDAPDSQNLFLTESLNGHDRRVQDRAGEFLSGGEIPLRKVTSVNGLVEADFLETMFESEKSATPFPDQTVGDSAVKPTTELNQQYRAGFDVDRQISQAEIQLQVALQRFGPEHPTVKAMRNRVAVLREFSDSLSRPSRSVATELLRHVKPSGTAEVDFKQLEIKSDISTEDFVELVGRPASIEGDDESKAEVDAAVELFRSFADDPDKQTQRTKFIEAINSELRTRVANYNRKLRQLRGWKRVKAVNNTSRLIVGDKDELDLTGMQVHVQVDGFRARVLIDYFYYNDRDQQLEGNFKIRLPDDSSLYYFAFGESAYDFSPEGPLAGGEFVGSDQYVSMRPAEIGRMRQDAWKNVKEAKVVPREKAAFAYKQTVRRRVDPALVEWSGAGVFNARVFPLTAGKLHRIVVGYDVGLTPGSDGHSYRLDLPEQTGQCLVDLSVSDHENGEWKLLFDGAEEKNQNQVAEWDAGKSIGDAKSQKQMRFKSPKWKSLTLLAANQKTVVLQSPESDRGQFFATQFRAEVPKAAATGNERAVFLVDTSLSSRPDKFNVWLDLIKATLENNQPELREFAVLFFDVDCRFWRNGWTDNTQNNVSDLMKDCFQIGLEGATNLHGAMLELSEATWLKGVDSRPTVFLLSDGAVNWGESDLRLIEQEYLATELGSVFAYQTGLNGTAVANLRRLTGATGGAVFSVTAKDEVAAASVAHKNKPWQLESLTAEGTTDLMTAGKVQWIYPNQWLTVVGRGDLNQSIKMTIRQGDSVQTISVNPSIELQSDMADRLYGQVAVGQLESLSETVFDIAASYARHFRIPGRTCSLLMLESEDDYRRFKIVPEDDRFVVQSKNASDIVALQLEKQQLELTDYKANLVAWMNRLESIDAIQFKIPTAFKLAMEELVIEPIDSRLNCEDLSSENWSKKYTQAIAEENLDASTIDIEGERRRALSADDAIRAHSSLVESSPGDWVVARDVAFTAMNLGRADVAYHLLRQVVQSRPFDGSAFAALGQCLHQLGRADMAMVFFEIALEAEFPNQGTHFKKIVATNYAALLRQVSDGKLESRAKEYATARFATLQRYQLPSDSDLIVSMMWNTDQTDVDLHVLEPSGEECFYQNSKTRSGGSITADVTNGFGPEMYVLPSAPKGEYQIKVKFYASNQNRTRVSNKVYLSIFTNYGSKQEKVHREMIRLSKVGEKELAKTIHVGE